MQSVNRNQCKDQGWVVNSNATALVMKYLKEAVLPYKEPSVMPTLRNNNATINAASVIPRGCLHRISALHLINGVVLSFYAHRFLRVLFKVSQSGTML